MRAEDIGAKTKYSRGTIAIDVTAPSIAKKTRDLSIADVSRVYSNKRSQENECSNSIPKLVGSICTM